MGLESGLPSPGLKRDGAYVDPADGLLSSLSVLRSAIGPTCEPTDDARSACQLVHMCTLLYQRTERTLGSTVNGAYFSIMLDRGA